MQITSFFFYCKELEQLINTRWSSIEINNEKRETVEIYWRSHRYVFLFYSDSVFLWPISQSFGIHQTDRFASPLIIPKYISIQRKTKQNADSIDAIRFLFLFLRSVVIRQEINKVRTLLLIKCFNFSTIKSDWTNGILMPMI